MRWILLQETLNPSYSKVCISLQSSPNVFLTLSLCGGSTNPCPWGGKPGDVVQLHEGLSTEPLKDTLTKAPGLEFPKCSSQKATLTGRALDSNPKPRMCRHEIRFHQVPVKCFPSAGPLLQCQGPGRWVGCPEHRAGVCLLLSRSQLFDGASELTGDS